MTSTLSRSVVLAEQPLADHDHNSDFELMQRIAANDPEAMRMVIERYSETCKLAVQKFTRDAQTIQDLCQDVWLSLFLTAYKYDSEKLKLSSWITMIAKRRSIDYLRQQNRRVQPDILDSTDEFCVLKVQESGLSLEDRTQAESVLGNLSTFLKKPEQAETILLQCRGLSGPSIALSLEIPEGTVKTHIHRGSALLRNAFDQQKSK